MIVAIHVMAKRPQ